MPSSSGDAAASQGTAPQPPTPAPRFLLRQRDPPTFTGDGSLAVEDWFHHVERICNYNNWDDVLKLTNIPFYLSGTPLTWYENNEASFDSWHTFKHLLMEAFGNKEEEITKAKQYLQTRHQASGEAFASYMADVLQACRKVNPDMAEAEKIRHLLKGLTQAFFTAVALHKFATVSELTNACKRFEDLQRQRILPDTLLISGAAPVSENAALTLLIRTIVREELERLKMSATYGPPSTAHFASQASGDSSLRQLVQQELKSAALPPATSVVPDQCRPSYADVCAGVPAPRSSDSHTLAPMIRNPPPAVPPAQEYFRPAYRRPVVCFYCHLPGHVARRCFRRQFDLQQEGAWYAPTGRPTWRPQRSFRPPRESGGSTYVDNDYQAGDPRYDQRYDYRNATQSYNAPRRQSRSPSPHLPRRRSVSPMNQTVPKYAASN